MFVDKSVRWAGHAVTLITATMLAACSSGSSSSSGTSSGTTGPVTSVPVTYTISGSVSGLATGEQVVVQNNGANTTTVTANGPFSFSVPVDSAAAYAVSIETQPLAQTCTITNPSGSNVVANVSNIAINCSAATETVLYSFGATSTDANTFERPSLILGSDGNFYGISDSGGANGDGTIFKMTPAGVETVLYSFTGGADGKYPGGPLLEGSDGNFYGTTSNAGANNVGTVFKMTPSGTLTTLYTFGSVANDGQNPYSGLIEINDVFYGVTGNGGVNGQGTVFSITPDGTETVLYSFGGGNDGSNPDARLMLASDGNLYGTTEFGGANNGGVLFSVTTSGVETVLHTFGAGQDLKAPLNCQLLQASDGNLYGVTEGGGTYSVGGLYRLTLGSNSSATYTLVTSFGATSTDVNSSDSTLIQGSDGYLYGTSLAGGANNVGTIYRTSLAGDVTILYSFKGGTSDGSTPSPGALVLGTDGYLYGIAGAVPLLGAGGAYGDGVFYRY